MYFIYLVLSIGQFCVARIAYKKWVNPISTYLIIWNIMIFLYELRLVYFYDISFAAWLLVILFQLIFFTGCILGNRIVIVQKVDLDTSSDRDALMHMILILSAISAVGLIPNFINFVRRYGMTFMDQMNVVYNDRLTGNQGYEMIPYIGTLSYLAVVAAGVYYRHFGFNRKLLIPTILMLLGTLPGGGRSGVILEIFLFLMPTLIFPRIRDRVQIKLNKTQKIIMVLGIAGLIFVFWTMSAVRSRWITVNQYMSPTMVKLVKISPAIYKTYVYIVEPFVAFSEWLKAPDFSFGINSFGMFYNLLNKLGMELPYERYQTAIYTPLQGNVATYIRELIQDFTIPGALIFLFIISVGLGASYKTAQYTGSFKYEALTSIWSTIMAMSFFVFFLRESVFWIMIIILPIAIYINRTFYKYKINIGGVTNRHDNC